VGAVVSRDKSAAPVSSRLTAAPTKVAQRLLEKTAGGDQDQVFTLHAELEGMKLAPAFEALVAGWKDQGYSVVAMRSLVAGHPHASLPLHTVLDGSIPGRSGTLAAQGPAFLGAESAP